jgi:hypothetical protein
LAGLESFISASLSIEKPGGEEINAFLLSLCSLWLINFQKKEPPERAAP